MLDGAIYSHQGKEYEVSFSRNLFAKLPVKLKGSHTQLLPWGRHKSQPGQLFLGSYIHLNTIYSGNLNKFQPKSVKLPISSFMVLDYENKPHWYEVIKGQYLQGLVAVKGNEQRVYIVVIDPDNELEYYPVWPRIIWD